jgi:hypothetical protein
MVDYLYSETAVGHLGVNPLSFSLLRKFLKSKLRFGGIKLPI